MSSRRGVTLTGTPSFRIAVFGFSVDPMLGVTCEILGFNSWLAHKSGPVVVSRRPETPWLILAQCRAQEMPGRRPGGEFAPDVATEHKSYHPDKLLQKRRASRRGSCCSRPARHRVADS